MLHKNIESMLMIRNFIEWDVENWSKAIDFWDKHIDLKDKNYCCLDVGGRNGGLSLWLALQGNNVICSDLENPRKNAEKLHKKFNCADRISYKAINALNIPFENNFDVVIFKSIIGGISKNKNDALKRKIISEIFKSLKPGGFLLFAENLQGSIFHILARRLFVKWGRSWNYLHFEEINDLLSEFDSVKYETVGFLGLFGRTEKQRWLLGKVDHYLCKIIPTSKRYIVFGCARKPKA